jgi:hypothetical protein
VARSRRAIAKIVDAIPGVTISTRVEPGSGKFELLSGDEKTTFHSKLAGQGYLDAPAALAAAIAKIRAARG